MNHACTYFDQGYLAQGLAMWRSLERWDESAVLWVLALDDETAEVLRAIGGERLHVVALAELLYLFRMYPEIDRLMYLDADLFFFGDPNAIAAEWLGGSVYVVPHRYPSWHDDAALYGRFNVGVLGFRRDTSGLACLDWWRARCLESCALTTDGTHYGDQKYLDEWPTRFKDVVESKRAAINLAPWNWASAKITADDSGTVSVNGEPLVVFHFAQFRRINGAWWDSGQLEYGILPRWMRVRIYHPYAVALAAAAVEVRGVRPEFSLPTSGWRATLGPWHLAALRIFWGQYWLYAGGRWFASRCGIGRFSGRAMAVYRRVQRGKK
jgi:hypothetical protein